MKRSQRRLLIFVATLFALSIGAGYAYAKKSVVVLKSKEVAQYEMATKGFKGAVSSEADVAEFDVSKYDKKDLLSLKTDVQAVSPEVILAVGTEALHFCSRHMRSTPIVYCMVYNPKESGVVIGSNVTGVSLDIPFNNQFELMKQLKPSLKKIGMFYDPDKTETHMIKAREVADAMGLELVSYLVRSSEDIESKFSDLVKKIDFLWMIPDSTVCSVDSIKHIFVKSLDASLPVMGISISYVKSGALVAMTVDYEDVGVQAGEMALKILGGTPASDITPEPSRKQDYVLNMSTAKTIGLSISSSVKKNAQTIFD